jgi:hypothetical protein
MCWRLSTNIYSYAINDLSTLTFKDEAQTALFKDPVRTAQ